jgi:hypothetical protein
MDEVQFACVYPRMYNGTMLNAAYALTAIVASSSSVTYNVNLSKIMIDSLEDGCDPETEVRVDQIFVVRSPIREPLWLIVADIAS